MENSLKSQLDSANSMLILLPTKPYFDQVAAGLAFYLAVRNDKNISISCPSDMLVEFNRLVGVNKVTKDLGNKNLVVKFSNYQATGIERVSYDIEDGEFKLTVIPKPGMKPPTQEQVHMSYSGVAADLLVLIGGANETHFPALSSKDLAGVKLIHIGTRALSTSENKEVLSFARPASSTSEIVAILLKENGYKIDADIATNLIMGIEDGSNSFTSQGTSADTFQVVSDLIRAGGQRKQKETQRVVETGSIPQPQRPIEGEVKEEDKEEPPKEWVGTKIYKGTSVS